MSRHRQESELEFERIEDTVVDYPIIRSIVVRQYGGTMEECVISSRKELGLDSEDWRVIRWEKAVV